MFCVSKSEWLVLALKNFNCLQITPRHSFKTARQCELELQQILASLSTTPFQQKASNKVYSNHQLSNKIEVTHLKTTAMNFLQILFCLRDCSDHSCKKVLHSAAFGRECHTLESHSQTNFVNQFNSTFSLPKLTGKLFFDIDCYLK